MSTPYAIFVLGGGVGVGSPQREAGILWKRLTIPNRCVTYAQELGAGILMKTQAREHLESAASAVTQISI